MTERSTSPQDRATGASPDAMARRQSDWDSAKAHNRIEGGHIPDALEVIAQRYIRGELDWDAYEAAYLSVLDDIPER